MEMDKSSQIGFKGCKQHFEKTWIWKLQINLLFHVFYKTWNF